MLVTYISLAKSMGITAELDKPNELKAIAEFTERDLEAHEAAAYISYQIYHQKPFKTLNAAVATLLAMAYMSSTGHSPLAADHMQSIRSALSDEYSWHTMADRIAMAYGV